MEVAGLAIGTVGLVALIGTCRDAIKRVESLLAYDKELRPFLELFKADHAYLELWQKRNGHVDNVNQLKEEPQSTDHRQILVYQLLQVFRDNLQELGYELSGNMTGSMEATGTLSKSSKSAFHPKSTTRGRLAWAIGGRKEKVMNLLQMSEAIISKIRLLQEANTKASSDAAELESGLMVKRFLRDRVRGWLNPVLTSAPLEKHLASRVEGTCQWLFSKSCWKNWVETSQQDPQNQFLWIHAPAGHGKSVLASSIIEHLLTGEENVAYFMYASDEVERRNPFAAVRSWLWQLIANDLQALNGMSESIADSEMEMSVHLQIWKAFRQVVERRGRTYLVLDGLDECSRAQPNVKEGDESIRTEFLQCLREHVVDTDVRIVIFSRPEGDIRAGIFSELDGPTTVAQEYVVCKEDTEQDLTAVATVTVDSRLKKRHEQLRGELSRTMKEKSDGMFLWIKLQSSSLKPKMTAKELKAVVEAAPHELSHVFESIWTGLANRHDVEGHRAMQILRWLTFAKRTLVVRQMIEALMIPDIDEVDDAELAELVDEEYIYERLEGICGSLVTIQLVDGKATLTSEIHLFHDSVRHFLIQKFKQTACDDSKTTTVHLGKLCLDYLSKPAIWSAAVTVPAILGSLKSHAIRYWYDYIDAEDLKNEHVRLRLKAFFAFDNELWERWRDQYENNMTTDALPGGREYYAAYFGYDFVLMDLQEKARLDINIPGGVFGTPLQAACYKERTDIVRYLLHLGANDDTQSGWFKGALPAAAYTGNTTIISLLLSREFGDRADHQQMTAMTWAACQNDLATLRLLFNAGCDSGAGEGLAGMMVSAVRNRNCSMIRFLVERGGDVKEPMPSGLTPLSQAARGGDLETVRCLVQLGAQLRVSSEVENESVLHIACYFGSLDVVEYLIRNGVSVNAWIAYKLIQGRNIGVLHTSKSNEKDMTPLQEAARRGHLDIVRLLLQNAARIDTQNDAGWTALHLAAKFGHHYVVEELLKRGATPNTSTSGGYSPLHAAIEKNDLNLVTLLFERGAVLDTEERFVRRSKFPKACELFPGQEDEATDQRQYTRSDVKVDALKASMKDAFENRNNVETEAIPRSQGSRRPVVTALNCAISSGHLPVVKYLLKCGSDPNLIDQCHGHPLRATLQTTSPEITAALLKAGAEITIVDLYGRSMLHCAIDESQLSSLDRLNLPATALTRRDCQGRLPVHCIAAHSVPSVLKWIVEKGADLQAHDHQLWTPLHWAAYFRNAANVETLMSLGASKNSVDRQDRLPYHVALEHTDLDVIQMLRPSLEYDTNSASLVSLPKSSIQCNCNFCGLKGPVNGTKKCRICADYDLCSRCLQDVDSIHPGHQFQPGEDSESSHDA